MVGVVLVSHSQKAAEGAAELALMMAPDARLRRPEVLKTAAWARVLKKSALLSKRRIKVMASL